MSKYSDTLHRFRKKEHDWGWKKFMELTKVHDGFVDAADNLIIKAQVQVIREKANKPFRCLDCQYRRELVRVYLTNVEQICRRFVEERRAMLGNMMEDKARWSSLCAFWQGIDQHSRCQMSRENMDVILKVVVKHFFIEKEVTSTLVMDSLYSGLKALESQNRGKSSRAKFLDVEAMPAPIIRMENDMFALIDDVLPLLERAAIEPLPPKDEKGPQKRTKDGNSGDNFNKDSIERDERRLTELGRRTVEIFVIAHIFSNKIEVAYQEDIVLKRQEELIREEEASQAESDQKAKHGASEKDRKSKKQGKQKRNKQSKDKGRQERPIMVAQDYLEEGNFNYDTLDSNMERVQTHMEKPDNVDDVSDVSDSIDGVAEVLQLDSKDRDACPVNWDTDTSVVQHHVELDSRHIVDISSVQNVVDKKSNSVVDDSSSTCSTDSLPSVIMNDSLKRNSSPSCKGQKSTRRGKSQRGKMTCEERNSLKKTGNQVCGSVGELGDQDDGSKSAQFVESEPYITLQDQSKCPDMGFRKAEELVLLQKKLIIEGVDNLEGSVARDRLPNEISVVAPSPGSPPRNIPFTNEVEFTNLNSCHVNPVRICKPSSNGTQQNVKDASSALVSSSQAPFDSKPFGPQTSTSKLAEKVIAQQVPVISKPSTAHIAPGHWPIAPVVSMVQTNPVVAHSVGAAGRSGPDPSAPTLGYVLQSYRNAIVGNPIASNSSSFTHATSSHSMINSSAAYTQQPSLLSSMLLSQSSQRLDSNTSQSGLPFGILARDLVQNGPPWLKSCQWEPSRNLHYDFPLPLNDVQNLGLYKPVDSRSQNNLTSDFVACTSVRQTPGLLAEDFPHLDIINDLLDDEHGIGVAGWASSFFQDASNGSQILNRQFIFPGETKTSGNVGFSVNTGRFERSRSYNDDGFQQVYSSCSSSFDSTGDYIPHPSPFPYVNGQVDGLILNQWQMAGSDLSYLSMRNTESDAYQYYSLDYLKMACGVNGNTIFRPSNGH